MSSSLSGRRTYALWIALFLLAGACSGDTAEESGLRAGVVEGPIAGLLVASSFDERGFAVDPTFTFTPDQEQMTVVVYAGEITGSPIDITWYRVGEEDQEEELFNHSLEIGSLETAYSTGVNPGTLASGTYRARVDLEGTTRTIEWDVAEEGETAAAEAAEGQPPVPGPSGVAAGRSTRDDEPDPNEKGTEDCALYLYPDGETTDSSAHLVDPFAGSECTDPDGREVTVGWSVLTANGYLSVGDTSKANSGKYLMLDPCSLSLVGGSDLPGASVRFLGSATATGGSRNSAVGNWTITLGDDTLAPRIKVNSSVHSGSRVKTGDEINFDVTARELRTGGPWQTGVYQLQVTGPDGLIEEDTDPSRLPKPCGQKKWTRAVQGTYKVPSNPPPIIELCAVAEDFAGNFKNNCGTFYTGEVWEGTMLSAASFRIPLHGTCSSEFETILRLIVAPDGSVSGEGRAVVVKPQSCPFPRDASSPRSVTMRVEGAAFEDRFEIQLFPVSISPPTNYDIAGFGANLGPPPPPQTIPITASGVAEGTFTAIYSLGGDQRSRNTFHLECVDCG